MPGCPRILIAGLPGYRFPFPGSLIREGALGRMTASSIREPFLQIVQVTGDVDEILFVLAG